MEFRSALSHLGIILEIFGILLIIPLLASVALGESINFLFIIAAAVSFVAGTLLDKKLQKKPLDSPSIMALALLGFVSVSMIGAVPYLSSASLLNALFESVSGFTTTGLTALDPETLPAGLLFWRSFTQWIGAAGIIIAFIMLVESPGISSNYLYGDETSEEDRQPLIRKALLAFGAYTLLGIALLSIAGMPLLDSVAHSFSGISTGGFSTRQDSISSFNSAGIEIAMIVLMVLGATSFFLHAKIFRGNFRCYPRNFETKAFWIFVMVFSMLMAASMGPAPLSAVFTAISALTTSGFSAAPPLAGSGIILVVILTIIGGFSASSAGGLKLVRAGAMGKAFPWIARKLSYPKEAVIPLKIGERSVKPQEFTIITLFIFMYMLVLVVSTAILSFTGMGAMDSFFLSASAAGNSAFSPLAVESIHWVGKATLMVVMVVGRLEILPLFVFVRHLFQARKRGGGDEEGE
ncbi:MAG: TrkH family potassium uptake protein [Candidatus Aenigmarchaeota archaeon]|nr:TrkH family potassium uptake protein [Candidatus Aenigmarchaeota archaeon]